MAVQVSLSDTVAVGGLDSGLSCPGSGPETRSIVYAVSHARNKELEACAMKYASADPAIREKARQIILRRYENEANEGSRKLVAERRANAEKRKKKVGLLDRVAELYTR